MSVCAQPVLCSAIPFAQPVKWVSWLCTRSVCLAKHLSLSFLWTSVLAESLYPSLLKQPLLGPFPGTQGLLTDTWGPPAWSLVAAAPPPVPSAMQQLALKWAGSSADETCCRASPGLPGQKHGGLKDTNMSNPHFTFSGPRRWQSSLSPGAPAEPAACAFGLRGLF